ncbi:hypothetical protein [Pseudoalteromonas sp. A757]|uniref:hypothetical protein n=1 Tax=Pseudoalteromonas sp. A757 TaxID=2250709 RepID=UPI000FFEDEC8|nr:hypothetical protein [Pseudoalteromonas sp. A757]RXE87782.1 hypothetical protein DRB05_06195 [Pseudoalteromonas sp. A757]
MPHRASHPSSHTSIPLIIVLTSVLLLLTLLSFPSKSEQPVETKVTILKSGAIKHDVRAKESE